MATINLSKTAIPGTSLADWMRSCQGDQNKEHGLEYLAWAADAAASDTGLQQYLIPTWMKVKDVSDTIIRETRYRFKKGQKPWSIRAMDELRSPDPSSIYHFDFFNPTSYDREALSVDGIPYSSPFVQGLVYLTLSIILGGTRGGRNSNITPPRFTGDLSEKLKDCLTSKVKKYELKAGYTRSLSLVMPKGGLHKIEYKDLGLNYLEDLMGWAEEGLLSKEDHIHAKVVLSKIIEALVDHRQFVNANDTYILRLPGFEKKQTTDQFNSFVIRALNLAYPNVKNYSLSPDSIDKAEIIGSTGYVYFQQRLLISNKYKIESKAKGLTIT